MRCLQRLYLFSEYFIQKTKRIDFMFLIGVGKQIGNRLYKVLISFQNSRLFCLFNSRQLNLIPELPPV